jgi:hypothetical protein
MACPACAQLDRDERLDGLQAELDARFDALETVTSNGCPGMGGAELEPATFGGSRQRSPRLS